VTLLVARRARLDAELVRRGLAPSREQAAALIAAGRVQVAGGAATKPATGVAPDTPLVVKPAGDGSPDYASRGGHKLAGALAIFARRPDPLTVAGKRCLDAGASTGGFTDVLLRAGAASVAAVDVGYGQLAWQLRTDERVTVHDRTNVRSLDPETIGGPVDLTVSDLSFIGLPVVLPALAACTRPEGDLVLLVKPQFEVGREALGPGGVVREPHLWASAIRGACAAAGREGLRVRGIAPSSLPGPSGNVEFLLWLAGPTAPGAAVDLDGEIAAAIDDAPDGVSR
jgi:23S rRNA (cytidine1920-2'-O)/16S rRNA (cytidine1409-2'-O)-methyltransferase